MDVFSKNSPLRLKIQCEWHLSALRCIGVRHIEGREEFKVVLRVQTFRSHPSPHRGDPGIPSDPGVFPGISEAGLLNDHRPRIKPDNVNGSV